MLKADGPSSLLVYSGKEVDAVYLGQQATANTGAEQKVATLEAQVKQAIQSDPKIAGLSKDLVVEKGKRVFQQTCFACHQGEGQGLPGVFPPLAKSDFLMADKERSIRAIVKGLSGPIVVNAQNYNGVMPPVMLTDEQIAHVLTYVRNSWGNSGDMVSVDEVKRVHAESANQ
jgi:nitrite reductase (NO-forming)